MMKMTFHILEIYKVIIQLNSKILIIKAYYPLSPTRYVPNNIEKPDYALNGYLFSLKEDLYQNQNYKVLQK